MPPKPALKSIAAELGVTSQRVTALKRQGMPVDSLRAAREWYAAHIRPRAKPQTADDNHHIGNVGDARRRSEEATAALKEFELAKRVGSIVDKAEVERAAYQLGRIIQKSFVEVLPGRMAMELAQMTDPWAIECYLRDQARAELAAVAGMSSDEVEKIA